MKVVGGKDGTTEKLFKASSRGSVYNKVFIKNMDKNSLITDIDGVVNMVESEVDMAFFNNPLKLMLDSCRLIFGRSHFERSKNRFCRTDF